MGSVGSVVRGKELVEVIEGVYGGKRQEFPSRLLSSGLLQFHPTFKQVSG